MPRRSTYPLLTLVQYLLAIGVLVVHSGGLFPNPVAHFVAKSLYGRLAVPVFLISSACFLQQQERVRLGATAAHLPQVEPAPPTLCPILLFYSSYLY